MKVLRPTDSRFRPDIREYEEGSNDKAAEIKTKMDKYNKEKFNKMEKKLLPRDINYSEIKGLRLEARQKLDKIKPENIGQASRISGVSPADISVLLIYLGGRK